MCVGRGWGWTHNTESTALPRHADTLGPEEEIVELKHSLTEERALTQLVRCKQITSIFAATGQRSKFYVLKFSNVIIFRLFFMP